jgi:ABC-type bacteriocin/lantibiotic exporter with double-glycine peptidase domain
MKTISKVISGNILYLIGAFFIVLGIVLLIVLHHPHMGPISIFFGVVIGIAGYFLRGRQIF